ncbi:hypothetical protein M9458_018453, partial [Cirrhinus mrigala]
ISEEDVCQVFRKNKRRKAPGPDGVTPACLKTCADQLAPIFSQIFNRSLELCEVPSCFKCSTIISFPKKPKITGLNDYRPVALTSVIMKSLEKLAYLKDITGPLLDPLQFAYRANSSAFNTIIPTLLQTNLNQLSVPSSISQRITSFLTATANPSVKLLKFADDTTLIGLIQDGEEGLIQDGLILMVKSLLTDKSIMDSTVAAVETFKFLGSIISQDLKWDTHIDSIAKKAQQRLYFLRQLKKFNLPQELLKQFYSVVIESVLCTSMTVWFGSATKSDTRRLQRTVRTTKRIIGAPLPTLQELYTSR